MRVRKGWLDSAIGKTFGRWTITGWKWTDKGRERARYAKVVCACGTKDLLPPENIRRGFSKSCGCGRWRTHGKSKTPGYRIWSAMVQRCTNPKSQGYKNYGGRGISICKKWMCFEGFYADMGDPPLGLSLDRRNNNGNYEPSNCQWVTQIEQCSNMRRCRYITARGRTQTISAWSRETGIAIETIAMRLKYGRTEEEAIAKADYTKAQKPRSAPMGPYRIYGEPLKGKKKRGRK